MEDAYLTHPNPPNPMWPTKPPNNGTYTLPNTAVAQITISCPDARNIRVGEALIITGQSTKYCVECIVNSVVTLGIVKNPSPSYAPLTKKRAQWLQQTYPNQNRGRK